ncbi:MAG: calcium-binding protein [Geminicoccaceae bacterium]|nr:calcium-binding protein [Geminicoccaceae bacterium]
MRRRSDLDRLLIGAPLTAAAVGLLLAENARSDGVDGGEAGTATGAMPVRPGDGGAALGGGASARAGQQSTWQGEGGGAATGAGAGAVGVSLGAGASASAEGSTGGVGTVGAALEAAGDPTASAGAKAAVHSGPSVSISFGGGLEGGGIPLGESDAGAEASERGDIGRHVQAGEGDDVIHGTDADDILFGGAGDDEIRGYAGDDLIDGGAGDDLLYGGEGDDRVFGGAGQDELHGGPGDDDLDGGSGNDLLFGNGGRDTLAGGAGADLLDGGSGPDSMSGGQGNDEFVIADLHDVALENQRAADRGGSDVARIDDDFSQDLEAAFGTDEATFLLGGDVDEAVPNGTTAFQQQLDPDIEHVNLKGLADHDVVGDGGDNRIVGNSGDNVLHGRGGEDLLLGGAGADTLIGNSGDDLLFGGTGDDILKGGRGDDELHGGDGDDLLDGGLGSDRMFGEGGNDTFVLGLHEDAVDSLFDHEGSNSIVIEGGQGHQVETALVDGDLHIVVDKNPIAVIDEFDDASFGSIDTGSGKIALGDLLAENAVGGSRAAHSASSEPATSDVLADYLGAASHRGGAFADHLEGTSAPDWLSGSDGDDVLSGAGGHDVLEGGNGADTLSGGAGDDVYLFRSGEHGVDSIRADSGADFADLQGFAGAKIQGVKVGQDLWITADNAPIFKVEQIDHSSFTGVRNGDEFVSVDDLLA